jgi:proteasome assembly chaperone (PAC2) family protein
VLSFGRGTIRIVNKSWLERQVAMGVKLYKRPRLKNPVMIASWPGIANIGLIAVNTLREALKAEEFGEIEPWDFFYPQRVSIKGGVLEALEFPGSKFYFRKTGKQDLIFFIGEEQPAGGSGVYAEGEKAYQIANLVLDVAEKFHCRRVYTSGAAVAPIHHTMVPRVWAVPNNRDLVAETRKYGNTILMSEIEGREGQGNIVGLNGLLLGVARKRGIEAICVMGEIPVYLQGLPLPYPKASRSVLKVLTRSLGIEVDISKLDRWAEELEQEIEDVYNQIPSEIKQQLEKLKQVTYAKPAEPSPITEEDKRRIMKDIDKFFKKRGRGIE